MKKRYFIPTLTKVNLDSRGPILTVTSVTNGIGDGEDYVKAEIVWDEEEQRTAYTNFNIWDEEW